jgi:hypothetical protein
MWYDAGCRDSVLPFSEFSMFAYRTVNANYVLSLSMVAFSACVYVYAMSCRRDRRRKTICWSPRLEAGGGPFQHFVMNDE